MSQCCRGTRREAKAGGAERDGEDSCGPGGGGEGGSEREREEREREPLGGCGEERRSGHEVN